jgi:hypothetical protein
MIILQNNRSQERSFSRIIVLKNDRSQKRTIILHKRSSLGYVKLVCGKANCNIPQPFSFVTNDGLSQTMVRHERSFFTNNWDCSQVLKFFCSHVSDWEWLFVRTVVLKKDRSHGWSFSRKIVLKMDHSQERLFSGKIVLRNHCSQKSSFSKTSDHFTDHNRADGSSSRTMVRHERSFFTNDWDCSQVLKFFSSHVSDWEWLFWRRIVLTDDRSQEWLFSRTNDHFPQTIITWLC